MRNVLKTMVVMILPLLCCGVPPDPIGEPNENPDIVAYDARFRALWAGNFITTQNGVSLTQADFIESSPVLDELRVILHCPDATRSPFGIVARGNGANASWDGRVHCVMAERPDCGKLVFTYEHLEFAVTSSGTLTMTGTAKAVDCDNRTYTYTLKFQGTRER